MGHYCCQDIDVALQSFPNGWSYNWENKPPHGEYWPTEPGVVI